MGRLDDILHDDQNFHGTKNLEKSIKHIEALTTKVVTLAESKAKHPFLKSVNASSMDFVIVKSRKSRH